ncbi:MAG: hypothetical protein V3U96_09550 [Paracoccaceae bacterium]
MTDKDTLDDAALDDLFTQASAETVVPSGALLARIIGDADQIVDGRQGAVVRRVKPGVLSRMLAATGGWPAMAGLTTVTAAGVWIGMLSPEMLSGVTDSYFASGAGYDLGDYMPVFSEFLDEG